jgi:hypothetical protein
VENGERLTASVEAGFLEFRPYSSGRSDTFAEDGPAALFFTLTFFAGLKKPSASAILILKADKLGNGFSRKMENYAAHGLNYFAYNFIKIHRTLPTSPAMAASVMDRLWSVGDLVVLWKPTSSGGQKERHDA